MEHKKKYVGLKLMRRPGAKRLEGENLSKHSRTFELERKKITNEQFQKLQQRFAILGLEAFNAELHQLYTFR